MSGRTGKRHHYVTLSLHDDTKVTYKYTNGELEVRFKAPLVKGLKTLICGIDGRVKKSRGFNGAEVGYFLRFLDINRALIQEWADEDNPIEQ